MTWQRAQITARAAAAPGQPPVTARRARSLRRMRHEHERKLAHRPPTDDVIRHYVCARHFSAGSCPAPASIAGTLLEPYVEDIVFELLRGPTPATGRQGRRGRAKVAATASRADRLPRQPARADSARRGHLRERPRRSLAHVSNARCSTSPPPEPSETRTQLPPADELEQRWPTMDIQSRRDVIRQVHRLRHRRQGQTARPRAGQRLSDRLRADRPTAPRRQTRALRSLEALHGHPAAVRQALRSHDRGAASGSRESFAPSSAPAHTGPPVEAFLDAGRFRLHQQVMLQGGEEVVGGPAWPANAPATTRRGGAGTTSASAARCAPTSPDKTTWPTRRQFEADGLRALRVAITRSGGIDRWIEEFGLPRPHRHNGQTGYWTERRIRTELTASAPAASRVPITRGRSHAPG